ncbi:hypothetical protein EJ06DRAFT_534584 [Trichodelitschia bisporula]|uniref:Rhodopsin domain-containing protein n=1 Tax=Trichodelitschia bisporula TaxID=703511 RepID=A0A6G1HIL4_9PEZI|nr:hypothetical protein EJ06DRAFT_534584 [Trichodelitschia bisporula]
MVVPAGPALPDPNHSTTPVVVGSLGFLLCLTILTCFARIYTRIRPYPNLGLDDCTIVISTILATINFVLVCRMYVATGGHNAVYFKLDTLVYISKLGFVIQPLWVWTITFIKVSVVLMLLRIKQSYPWRVAGYSMIALLFAVAIVSLICQLLQCKPISHNWDVMAMGAGCWSQHRQDIATFTVSSVFVATDIACALLPLLFIRKINRPLRERILLGILLSLGLFASACGLAKVIIVDRIHKSRTSPLDNVSFIVLTWAEQYIGIIAACIPCLKALFESALRALGGPLSAQRTKRMAYSGSRSLPLDSLGGGRSGSRRPAVLSSGSGVFDGSYGPHRKLGSVTHDDLSDENVLLSNAKVEAQPPGAGNGLYIMKQVEVSWKENSR